MSHYSTEVIRNVALAGPSGAGKSSLFELLLSRMSTGGSPGGGKRGTVGDAGSFERTFQHTCTSSLAGLVYDGHHINLLDTPGYPDFIGRTLAILPAVETVAVVINAHEPVSIVAERIMAWSKHRGMDRMIIVNQIDHPDADPNRCLTDLRDRFGPECLPLNLPAGKGTRVEDCYFAPDRLAVTDFSSVEAAHRALIDQVVEVDEALMTLYLEQGQDLDAGQLHAPFEQALCEGHLFPVCFVSARTGAGVDQLLRVVADLMPNPSESNPPLFVRGSGDDVVPVAVTPDPAAHVLAHVFKVIIDPFAGRTSLFRVHQGTLKRDSQLFVGDGRKPVRIAHLLRSHGREWVETDCAVPGDICAVTKLDDLHFDAVLHDSHEEDHIHLKSVAFPAPMFGLAIRARSRNDEQRLSDVLAKLTAEDPSLAVEHNVALNETILRGLGELHLRATLETMRERFHLEVDTSPPRIAYRETVASAAEGHYRHKKQTGGSGQFGEVHLKVRPLDRGAGFRFVDEVVGGAIPRQYIPAVEKGVREVLHTGVLAGFPLVDVEVTVYDGKHHPVDSKEVAFVMAGKKAFIEAVRQAQPVLLEPIVEVHVTAPNGSVGDITADLSGKRGRISKSTTLNGGMVEIQGQVPLSELDNYQTRIKSLTAGDGFFTMEFRQYDPVPVRLQQQLASSYKPVEVEA